MKPVKNNVTITDPDSLHNWDYEKNQYSPECYTRSSAKKVWWKCENGHSWEANFFSKVAKGTGCTYCSGKKLWVGVNDLESQYPEVLGEWDYDKNNKTPDQYFCRTNAKAWWKCGEGHSYEHQISKRVKLGEKGCVYCHNKRVLAGYNDLASRCPNVAAQWDYSKNKKKPEEVLWTSIRKYYFICENGHELYQELRKKTQRGYECAYCSNQKLLIGWNDLETRRPDILSEWDYKKNKKKPENYTFQSHSIVWWECSEHHSWEAMILSRTRNGDNCPVCSNKKVVTKVNDFESCHPEMMKEWNHEKNKTKPSEYSQNSSKKAWWICDEGHEWESSIYARVKLNAKCPYCINRRILEGYNDLKTKYPMIAAEWDYEKNDFSPEKVTYGSDKKVWWKCGKNHSWETKIVNRTYRGYGCPVCAGKKVVVGYNDLFTISPFLEEQWDHDKNIVRPEELTFGSGEKVWWKCGKGHSWKSSVSDRSRGVGCPGCKGIFSVEEKRLAEYITDNIDGEVITNDRIILGGKELDIYIPGKGIAIEYNGIYWHSEKAGKDKNYHYSKWLMCKEKGIQLITIWQDDWCKKEELVKKMISHKLGFNDAPKVYARNTTVEEITYHVSQEFCDSNHIQGSTTGSYYNGLHDESSDALIAAAVWRKNGKTLYLDRYCTSVNVVGGMGKLLKDGIRYASENDCDEIVTFADHEVSDGGLYEKLGFEADSFLEPDYKYFYLEERHHKFNFRKKRFQNDPLLTFSEDLTEKQLAEINSIPRIWDCGKTRYVMKVNNIDDN